MVGSSATISSGSAMSAEALDRLAAPLCRGRRLVAFHRVLQAGLLVVVVIAMLVNLVVDLSYRIIDPRVRLS